MLGRSRKRGGGKGSGHGRRGLKAASKAARTAPRQDSDVIFKIKQHLRKVHGIPAGQIKTEYAIGISKGGNTVLGPAKRRKSTLAWGAVRTPDIVVVDGDGKIWFVIEQDGRIHESGKVAKRDETRNRHYATAGIPCVIMSTRAIRTEGITAAEYLDLEMGRVLGTVPDGQGRHTRSLPGASKRPDG